MLKVLLFSLLLLAACDRHAIEEPDPGTAAQYAYFPLEIGKYIIYQMDSTVYDYVPGGTIQFTARTFLREIVADTFRDNTGQLLYTIERAARSSDTAAWQPLTTWTAGRNAMQAIRTEDNLRFLRLVFPMSLRTDWDGNLWIDKTVEVEVAGETLRPFANWHYSVDALDVPEQIGAFQFPEVLTVTEADDENLIERRFSKAQYAKGIGLVWREQWILDSQYCNQIPPPADCDTKPWEAKAEKGYILRQTVLEYN